MSDVFEARPRLRDHLRRKPRPGHWRNVWRVTNFRSVTLEIIDSEPYGENLWLAHEQFPTREIAEQKAMELLAKMPSDVRLLIEWEDAVFIEAAP